MVSFQTVRGTRDLLPKDARKLRRIINKASKTSQLYGYREVITPILESYELLNAKSGEEIRQRMFIFEDLGGRKIVLRPEFTASIARLVTTSLKKPLPMRFFSVGTVYRYDEPQRGRYREFWQSNFELIGSNTPEADAEVILLTNRFMKKVGLRNYVIKLGHVGILRGIMTECDITEETQNAVLQKMDKKEYDSALELIPNANCRLMLQNLRMLNDSSDPRFSHDPHIVVERIANLVQGYEKVSEAVENLKEILTLVTKSGCKIGTIDPAFARGLEYYTGMIFEVYIPELEIALGGGGRYDKLIETFGGESTPAVGVAHGLDRIMLAEKTQRSLNPNIATKVVPIKRVLIVAPNKESKGKALRISERLRNRQIVTEFEIMGRTLDKSLKKAKLRKIDQVVVVDPQYTEGTVLLIDLTKDQYDRSSKRFLDELTLFEELKQNKKIKML